MKTITPIRRSAQMAPLSREHHETLLLSWKIRQGIKFGIKSERISGYCEWFWHNHMKDHFIKEEQGFKKILPENHPMMGRMVADHEAIKIRMANLSGTTTVESFEALAEMISVHVRFEEREMFNYIEETASREQLDALADEIKVQADVAEWKDEFWVPDK